MYKQISDYGIIGDTRFSALVSNEGSIDYCSLNRFDNPTVFASMLDDEIGGYFSIRPLVKSTYDQIYLKNTNILQLNFKSENSHALLTDFVPIGEAQRHDKKTSLICRILEQVTGSMKYELVCFPAPNYAQEQCEIYENGNVLEFRSQYCNYFLKTLGLKQLSNHFDRGKLRLVFELCAADKVYITFGDCKEDCLCDVEQLYLASKKYWYDWISSCAAGSCPFLGEYDALLKRSLLVLKLLSYAPNGAIIAASTTSLPEAIGANRNWDYRYTWIRDASFTLKALFDFGHINEADGFIQWLSSICSCSLQEGLKIMYPIDTDVEIYEQELKHLKGYKNSQPVRIGNEAYEQNQWDIYGELLDAFLRISDFVGQINVSVWPFLKNVCEMAIENWNKADAGIWEHRNGPFHFTYSKAMCWVAIDRALKIARRYGFDAPIDRWTDMAKDIKEDVMAKAFNKSINSFVQSYGSDQLDASLLLLPLMGFVAFDDPRTFATIDACERELMQDGFMMRYKNGDGLQGEEGSFLLCNFWYVQCLAKIGQVDKAKKVLQDTISSINKLGLFSEEFDFTTKEQLGNFPQAFSHIGLLNSVNAIMDAENLTVDKSESKSTLSALMKILPIKAVLNKGGGADLKSKIAIASELRRSINMMHGTYFDSSLSKVNYRELRKSQAFNEYKNLTLYLNTFDLRQLRTDAEKKAFWINIYNVLIVHGVIELNVKRTVREVFNYFSRVAYQIAGQRFSADDIEHGILRCNHKHPGKGLQLLGPWDKRREYMLNDFDPRIHFALVCAASSCPPIEFYTAEDIDNQLDLAAQSFMNRDGLKINYETNVLYLSQIFKWYKTDFAQTETELLAYLANYCDKSIRPSLINGKFSIEYLPYQWELNTSL